MAKADKQSSYNFIDLFAGAGGLSEGFIQAGFHPVAHVEMNEYAAKTLETRSDYSPKSSDGARAGSSLVDDGYAAIVDGWLTAGLATACWTVS